MRVSENAQELLELLWVAIEQEGQAYLGGEIADSDSVDELVKQGLVERHGNGLLLTEAGVPEAAMAVRRHRLAERLLVDVLTTEEAQVEEHACRFEHVLVGGVEESICTLLGHPRICPHGKPIPPGDCCLQMQNAVGRLIAPLCDMQPGETGQIAYVQMHSPKRLHKLMAMGILPGTRVTLMRRSPSFVFEAALSQFAVDRDIAADVYVRLERPATDPPVRSRQRRRRWRAHYRG